MTNIKRNLGFLTIIIITILVMLIMLRETQPNFQSGSSDQTSSQSPIVTPTPFPFQQLTIPSLRRRTYQSRLGELVEYQKHPSYTSYLTSYDSDNLDINGLLTIPSGTMPSTGWPAIVFVHGYIPPSEYITTQKYIDYIDYLARNQFVVFKIDLRGHGQSEGQASGAYYSPDYVIDTLNARAALAQFDQVNPNAVGLWGHSMAGNIVLRSLVVDPTIKAAVIWAGAGYTYEDLRQYRINDSSYRPPSTTSPRASERQRLFDTYGQFDPASQFWSQVNPTNYLSDLNSNYLDLHHAVDDSVVSINYSRNLVNVAQKTPLKVELFEYPSGGHNLTGSSFALAMQRTVSFFNKRLIE